MRRAVTNGRITAAQDDDDTYLFRREHLVELGAERAAAAAAKGAAKGSAAATPAADGGRTDGLFLTPEEKRAFEMIAAGDVGLPRIVIETNLRPEHVQRLYEQYLDLDARL